ncbi:Trichodiene synthase-domain-containing protein [Aspergillus pseudotamarii]|uniref:Trichodiene synthase-domain-containing protein n=1 Tax=Aspergillus pseudotamarii TaxID=132259 RepID=A0A5N6T3J5_ASPPS|nr:Trichodiene synthase-domain-containing protein [Aspergillus pseudotamarii]KAE8140781.1 Trichodiene synthase-domain-containing protein [Aspergillus pseudotamarii]
MAFTLGGHSFAYYGFPPSSTKDFQVMQIKYLVKKYLESIHFDANTPYFKDEALEETVWGYFQSLNMGEKIERSSQKMLKITGLYMFLLDDVTEEFTEGLQQFGQNLSIYYGPYCHSVIIKSMFDYINGHVIEHKMEQSGFKFSANTCLMPTFLRTKTGGAEILVHMLWPKSLFPEEQYFMQYFPVIQEMVLFIGFTNEILLYYKECFINEEKGNFVSNFAQAHEVDRLDVLRQLSEYIPQGLTAVFRTLQHNEVLRKPIEQFVISYVRMMTTNRRYHLVELFADEQYLPPYNDDA